MALVIKSILSDGEVFELSIQKHKGKWDKKPMLSVYPYHPELQHENYAYCWDNADYLIELYRDLKKKKKNDRTYEFKDFCKKHSLDYKRTRKELLDIFKQSKREKFWK